jgi:hypothetical protein
MRKLLFGLIFSIFLLSFITSAPPFESTSTGGLQFSYSQYEVLKADTDFRLQIHVINDTSVQTNETTTCVFHLYNQQGDHVLESEMGWNNNDLEFSLLIDGGNLSSGNQAYIIYCNNTNNQNHLVNGKFMITETGFKLDEADSKISSTGIIFLLLMGIAFLFFGYFLTKGEFWARWSGIFIISGGFIFIYYGLIMVNFYLNNTLLIGSSLTGVMRVFNTFITLLPYISALLVGFAIFKFKDIIKAKKQSDDGWDDNHY